MTFHPATAPAPRDASFADVVDSLRLLQLIAYLQSDLYSRAAGATGFVPAAELAVIALLSTHEAAHVAQLTTLLSARSSTAAPRPVFDFTAKGALPAFAFGAGQYETFRTLAQAFEDLAVRAYKGQVQALASDKVALNAVLAIHAVEARHAAELRRLRGVSGWITGNGTDGAPAFLQAVYAGEEVTTQGTVNVAAAVAANGGATAASQAFDEPLTAAQVTAVLALFIA